MAKFCIYESQISLIRHALHNGGILEIKNALKTLEEVQTYYAIAGLSKEDIAGKLFGDTDLADRIEDLEIEEMADDMGNSYLENGYWIDIDSLGESIKDRINNDIDEERG